MSVVFISYKRTDRSEVEAVADLLTRNGHEVYWDTHLEGGEEFREELFRQIDRCEYFVILISATTGESSFVVDEFCRAYYSKPAALTRRFVPLLLCIKAEQIPTGLHPLKNFHAITWKMPDALERPHQQLLSAVKGGSSFEPKLGTDLNEEFTAFQKCLRQSNLDATPLFELRSSIKLTDSLKAPHRLAWRLLRVGLIDALIDLIANHKLRLSASRKNFINDYRLRSFLSGVPLDPDDLRVATSKQLGRIIKLAVSIVLQRAGVPTPEARVVAEQVQPHWEYFSLAELMRHSDAVTALRLYFSTVPWLQQDHSLSYIAYSKWLQVQIYRPIHGEAFSLQQIYCVPRLIRGKSNKELASDFNLYRKVLEQTYSSRNAAPPQNALPSASEPRPHVPDPPACYTIGQGDLEIASWLADSEQSSRVRFLSGGPGSGKSSFAKYLAARISASAAPRRLDDQARLEVYYIPLHTLDFEYLVSPGTRVRDAIWHYLQSALSTIFLSNPLDTRANPSAKVLILDGLDEIGMAGQESKVLIDQLLKRTMDDINRQDPTKKERLKVLICGRTQVVQNTISHIGGPDCLYQVVGYVYNAAEHDLYVPEQYQTQLKLVRSEVKNKLELSGPIWESLPDGIVFDQAGATKALLDTDQRLEWWTRYQSLRPSGRLHDNFPSILNVDKRLKEISSSPLLLFLLSMPEIGIAVQVGVSPKAQRNVASIYELAVAAVFERHEKEKQLLSQQFREWGITRDLFFRLLEDVGLAAWHENMRTASAAEIRRCSRESGTDQFLDSFKAGAEGGLGQLLLAFYFRQSARGGSGDSSFEFTHKSFVEYFTSRRIVETIARAGSGVHASDSGKLDAGNAEASLERITFLLGGQRLTEDLMLFLAEELEARLRTDNRQAGVWIEVCRLALSRSINGGISFTGEGLTSRQVADRARNAEELMFVLIGLMQSCLARIAPEVGEKVALTENVPQAVGETLSRCFGVPTASSIPPISTEKFVIWRGWNFRKLVLNGLGVWYRKQCIRCDFSEARLYMIDLTNSELSRCTFEKAHAPGSSIFGARIRECNFNEINLPFAMAHRTSVWSSEFCGAKLHNSHFEGMLAESTSFDRALLSGASFNGAIMTKCTFRGASGKGAQFRYADLRSAAFNEANANGSNKATATTLVGTDFTGADLADVDFSGADLQFSVFDGANLRGANLSNAKLDHATFREANLALVDLSGASIEECDFEGAFLGGVRCNVLEGGGVRAFLDKGRIAGARFDDGQPDQSAVRRKTISTVLEEKFAASLTGSGIATAMTPTA